MNPDTKRFEQLHEDPDRGALKTLLRPDGTPVPRHWPILTAGELVELKGITFRVGWIGETSVVIELVSITDEVAKLKAKFEAMRRI